MNLPSHADKGYGEFCQQLGMHRHAAALLEARDKGLYYLATVLWDIGIENAKTDKDPYGRREDKQETLAKILVCLISMDDDIIQAVIRNELHELFFRESKMSNRIVHRRTENKPVIYALVDCDENGIPPSVRVWGAARNNVMIHKPGNESRMYKLFEMLSETSLRWSASAAKHGQDAPVHCSPPYIGYTGRPHQRAKQHSSGKTSHWLKQ